MILSVHVLHCCEPVALFLWQVIGRFACVGVSLEYLRLLVLILRNGSNLPRFRLRVFFVVLLVPVVGIIRLLGLVVVSFLMILLLRLVLLILAASVFPLIIIVSNLVLWIFVTRSVVAVLVLISLSLILVSSLVSIISIASSSWGSLGVFALIIVGSLPTPEASVFLRPYLVVCRFFLLFLRHLVDDLSQILVRVVNDLSLLWLLLFAIIFENGFFRSKVEP